MLNGLQREQKAINHIENLLDTIKLYLNADKYTFDYARVEQILEQAVQTAEQTAHGVKPVNLPADIPFSDSLDEEGRSNPYRYAGDMSPKGYNKLVENYEKDKESINDISEPHANDTPRAITVYQSPDRRHCDLRQIENNGKFDDTDMPGRRYFLPGGFHIQYGSGHMPRVTDSKGRNAYLIDSDSGYPYLHTIDSNTGHISQNGIPLRPYSESPAELWNEYNTLLDTIDYNFRHGRFGADRNGTTFRLAITDCQKIIDSLYEKYVQNPGDKNIRDELAAKHEQRKWLEKETHYFNPSEQRFSPSPSTPAEESENDNGFDSEEETPEQGMTM